MKKVFLSLITVMLLVIIPFNVSAKEVSTGLLETLKDEGIEIKYPSYKESDDQVKIYLFRGTGCPHCYEFLEFLNDISKEYGKKFKLVSYEVYYNKDNLDLKNKVGKFLEQESSGVPYIVIGDKVFVGYASSYDDQIKAQIDLMYKTKKSKRYDVIKEINKKEMDPATKVIIANIIVTSLASIGIITYVNQRFKRFELANIKATKKNK